MKHTSHSLVSCKNRNIDARLVLDVAQALPKQPGTVKQVIVVCCNNKVKNNHGTSDYDCIVIDPIQMNIVTITGFRMDQLEVKSRNGTKIVRITRDINIRK